MKNQTEPIMEDSVTTAYVSVLETTRMDLLRRFPQVLWAGAFGRRRA